MKKMLPSGMQGWFRALSMILLCIGCASAFALPPHMERVEGRAGILFPGESLHVGEILYSRDRHNSIVLQDDGNVVVYNRSGSTHPIWSTNTAGSSGQILSMQGDGNLVLYDMDWQPIWASGTQNNHGAYLAIQDDGNLVIYRRGSDGRSGAIWSSSTNGNY